MNHRTIYYFLLFTLIFASCNNNKQQHTNNQNITEEYKIQYAKGFGVKKYSDYTRIDVINPWDTSVVLQTYLLVDKSTALPSNLPKGRLIRTPLSSVVAYSTIHSSTLKELGSVDIITGVCESAYMDIEEIRRGIKSGQIKDFGMANNPDVEQILSLSPEAIFASPISGQSYGNVEKISIPIIETPDYTEISPLGRAEWIRFYSLFVGKEQEADSLFNTTVKKYNEIKELAKKHPSKHKVFNDMRYMGIWNMGGGKSYMAHMIADAGADYVWADDESSGNLPLSFETVLDMAGNAQIWLLRYHSSKHLTYRGLESEYKPYSYFDAFKNKNIWACNTMHSRYYEDLPIHPERILKDYAAIFNPELFPGYTTQYFQKLEE